MAELIRFTLNGKPVSVNTDGDRHLLWVLRGDLKLTGTKYGCGHGYCGACTVLMDDEPVRSCRLPVRAVGGKSIVTIEGLGTPERLHPLQRAFAEHDALQCGFCTPGMILSAYGLLRKHPQPTRQQIVSALDGNLCRCGAHKRIIEAVQAAAAEVKGAS